MIELKMQEVSERYLSSCLMDQQPKPQNDASILLSSAFLKHTFPLSLVDFGILTIFTERFGSDCLKRVMMSYCEFMRSKQLTAQQLTELSPVQYKPSKDFVIGECKIVKKASEYGLEKLVSFQTRFCNMVNINRFGFVMGEMNTEMDDSFTVRWIVLSALVSDIIKSASNVEQGFYQEFKITSFTLNGMWLFLNEAEIDAMWSQVHVSDTKFKDQFHTMYEQIVYQLQMGKRSEDQLSQHFMELFKCQQHINNY